MSAGAPPAVKLCGLRGTGDARAAVRAGADIVGIVLVPGTRRFVPPPTAATMVSAIREEAHELGRFAPEVVAVAGSMSLAVAGQLVTTVGVDAVQLVGDEHECAQLADVLDGTPLIRAIGVDADSTIEALLAQAERWEARGARVVFDAAVHGQFGGTGHRIPADVVRPLLAGGGRGLAGGLDPDNVAQVVRELAPAMVDVSSGIESHAGHKEPELMRAFVAAVRAACIDDLPADLPTAEPDTTPA